MKNTHFDPLDIASLQMWRNSEDSTSQERTKRLLTNLPLAVEQELTPRQRQILRMHFSDNMRVTDIALELGVNKSTVSRTLLRAMDKLYRSLRYSL